MVFIRMKYISLLTMFLLISSVSFAQTAEEQLDKYGSVELHLEDSKQLREALEIEGVYLDHCSHKNDIHLVCTPDGYRRMVATSMAFEVKPREESKIKMRTYEEILSLTKSSDCMPTMDFYPSYPAYVEMMYAFEEMYPELCELIIAGTLNSGRQILILKIGNGDENPLKSNFFYTSTMHGDEVAGYPMMLMLIDHLLCNYGSDDRVTELVDGINIYINPLANPDGTYRGGDNTIQNATRFNSNFVDLNRNFPDPKGGNNPDNRNTQEETLIFMDFAENVDIHLSANLHGGVELINYPWDTYIERHADNDWFVRISRDYADTVQHYSPVGYFTDLDNGVTNGYDWYEVEGGRQDYHIYFKRGRETTIELSQRKLLSSSDIPAYWGYNKNALINYMEESMFGLRGLVTDCNSGEALEAEVFIEDHDRRNSSVFSSDETGAYFRFLDAGTYEISFTAPGYDTLSYPVSIVDMSTSFLDVALCPADMTSVKENFDKPIYLRLQDNIIWLESNDAISSGLYTVTSMGGQIIQKGQMVDTSINLTEAIPPGIYVLNLEISGRTSTHKFFYR